MSAERSALEFCKIIQTAAEQGGLCIVGVAADKTGYGRAFASGTLEQQVQLIVALVKAFSEKHPELAQVHELNAKAN